MIAQHVHQALAQVREMKTRIIEQQRFRGYSGNARMLGGVLAGATGLALQLPAFPSGITAHVVGWGVLFSLAILVNYGAVVKWFLFDPEVARDIKKLYPAFDLLAPLFVGGMLTLSFLLNNCHNLLFGMWMGLFGIMNLISRRQLPKKIMWVGMYYILIGSVLLLLAPPFTTPWPMGLTFCLGECAGGYILEYDND